MPDQPKNCCSQKCENTQLKFFLFSFSSKSKYTLIIFSSNSQMISYWNIIKISENKIVSVNFDSDDDAIKTKQIFSHQYKTKMHSCLLKFNVTTLISQRKFLRARPIFQTYLSL